jgi:hypothetical protein
MTKIPTATEIKNFHEEVFTKLALADMLHAADPDGPPLCMPLGQRSSEVGRYLIANNVEPAVVPPLTAAQFDRLLEVVKLLHVLRKRTGRAMSELVQRLAKFDNAVIDSRSKTMATREELDEIFASVRCMLDEMLSVTEARMVELTRLFDAAYARRIAEVDAALDRLQDRQGRPPLN